MLGTANIKVRPLKFALLVDPGSATQVASRFAIKEAVLKALGTGWGDGIVFTDVEVVSQRTGAPAVVLHRRLVAIANERGIIHWLVSASHTSAVAMASVIALAS